MTRAGSDITCRWLQDQQVASQVMNAACRAEDQQQLQVRHFRSVLYGAAIALFVSAGRCPGRIPRR
jgi:hypothetical protein